ncbi:hypothetical protein [Aeromicrobium sp.]|uniref:hypothetical protein n=1 Tax=Aeromicrobium sp. TaxID=1871063 RepID=UPI0025BCD1FB|nr:hypothetical protein [Aeromicrobium sp.]MCK5891695.1 hypothetical protein [Aeromicrobium sp.]
MLTVLYSAKGAPGVTSAALSLSAVWPRPVVLLEADLAGSDLALRCRGSSGAAVASTPNLLGFAAATRGDRDSTLTEWAQPLACGVQVVLGVQSPTQARGVADLWHRLAVTAASADIDVIADLGRLNHDQPTMPLMAAADLRIPVMASAVESILHTRTYLLDVTVAGGRTVPLLVGPGRTAAADCRDVDGVMSQAGIVAATSTHLPLDHPGLAALEGGVSPTGRGRTSQLVRGARAAADHLLASAGLEVR